MPLPHIHQNHRGIDEGMLAIQLRAKRARLVPIRGITHDNGSISSDAPGLLVYFFDGWRHGIRRSYRAPGWRCASSNFHLLDVRAKVANLIQRVPGRHLDQDFIGDIRNGHRNVKEMLFGMRERNFITNSGL